MKKFISTVLALGMAASLAACGGSASTAASTESTAASAAEATADSDLAYIKNKGKMTIGYTVYEPMNYTDADGNFTGFDTELATAVCAKLGVEPDFVEINWDTKIVELDAKSIDCIWNGMTLTDDIMANTACTKAYAKNAQVVVMKADADYSSTADLVGKTIVAEAGQVLGMTKTQIFFRVTLLQVIKRILPPMGNEIITLVKDTSLANVIANKDIIMMAKEYSAKGLIWPLFSTAVFFLVFVGALTLLFGWLEKRLDYFK